MNIFVAKLSPSTSSEDLRELFSEYGEVKSANVIMDRATGHSKRFGFVEMANDEEGQKAIDELDEAEYDNSQIVVKKARPKEDGGQGGGGGQRRPSGNFRGGNNRSGGEYRGGGESRGGGGGEYRGGGDRGGDRGGHRKNRYED